MSERRQIFNIRWEDQCDICVYGEISDLFHEPICRNDECDDLLYQDINGTEDCPHFKKNQTTKGTRA